MPKLGEIPPEINLNDGESVTVAFNPAVMDIGIVHGERGTQYVFPVSVDGKAMLLKGGKRLFNAIGLAVTNPNENRMVTLKVTAIGAQRTLGRDYKVTVA